LDLPHERDDVAPRVAAETLPESEPLVHPERGCLLGVERAQAHPADADPAEWHVLLDDLDEWHGGTNPLDVLVDDPHSLEATGAVLRRRSPLLGATSAATRRSTRPTRRR